MLQSNVCGAPGADGQFFPAVFPSAAPRQAGIVHSLVANKDLLALPWCRGAAEPLEPPLLCLSMGTLLLIQPQDAASAAFITGKNAEINSLLFS